MNSWKTFFETCHALSFSMITLPFKSVSGDVRILISFHWIQVRSEVINVYFDETEELSAKTYLFHLSPSIVFHNLLNIPVTFLLEVCYILFIKYSNHYIKKKYYCSAFRHALELNDCQKQWNVIWFFGKLNKFFSMAYVMYYTVDSAQRWNTFSSDS